MQDQTKLIDLGFTRKEADDFRNHTDEAINEILRIREMASKDPSMFEDMVSKAKSFAAGTEEGKMTTFAQGLIFNKFTGNPYWFASEFLTEANRLNPGTIPDQFFELLS